MRKKDEGEDVKSDEPSVISGGIPPRKTFWEKWLVIWYWSIVIGSNFIGKYPRHDGIELGRPALWTICGWGCGWEWTIEVFPRICNRENKEEKNESMWYHM